MDSAEGKLRLEGHGLDTTDAACVNRSPASPTAFLFPRSSTTRFERQRRAQMKLLPSETDLLICEGLPAHSKVEGLKIAAYVHYLQDTMVRQRYMWPGWPQKGSATCGKQLHLCRNTYSSYTTTGKGRRPTHDCKCKGVKEFKGVSTVRLSQLGYSVRRKMLWQPPFISC